MAVSREQFDDEIDLRALVQVILRSKWLVLGLTLLAAVAGFLVSKLVLPDQYQATAYVIMTKPVFTANLDQRIQATLQMPDIKSLIDLVKSDDLIQEILQSDALAPYNGLNRSIKAVKGNLEAAIVGTSQIRLEATSANAEQAAELVNTWAEVLTRRLNSLFGVDTASLEIIDQQVEESRQAWDQAEQALLDYLPNNQVESLQVEVEQGQLNLEKYLEKLATIDLLTSDAQVIRNNLGGQERNSPVSVEDALSLIALQQRVAGGTDSLQFQVSAPVIIDEDYTVVRAQAVLESLVASLDTQRTDLQASIDAQKQRITRAANDLEAASYQLEKLTVQRDLALSAYQALSNQAEELRIALAQNDQTVKVGGEAVTPSQPSGPSTMLNTLIAGTAGLVISLASVLVYSWWKNPQSK